MSKNINTSPVRVVKDLYGHWDATTPAERQVSCDSKLVAYEDLYAGIDGDNCGTYELGTKAHIPSANTIATAKLSQPDGGYIWIIAADYNALVVGCNSCCD